MELSIEEIKKHNEDQFLQAQGTGVPDEQIFMLYLYDGRMVYAVGNNFSEAINNYCITKNINVEDHDKLMQSIMYFHRGTSKKFEWINESRVIGWRMINSDGLNDIILAQQRELNNLNFKIKKVEDYLVLFVKHFLALADSPTLRDEVIAKSNQIINAWQKKYSIKE